MLKMTPKAIRHHHRRNKDDVVDTLNMQLLQEAFLAEHRLPQGFDVAQYLWISMIEGLSEFIVIHSQTWVLFTASGGLCVACASAAGELHHLLTIIQWLACVVWGVIHYFTQRERALMLAKCKTEHSHSQQLLVDLEREAEARRAAEILDGIQRQSDLGRTQRGATTSGADLSAVSAGKGWGFVRDTVSAGLDGNGHHGGQRAGRGRSHATDHQGDVLVETVYRLDEIQSSERSVDKSNPEGRFDFTSGTYVVSILKLLWLADAFCKAWIVCYCAAAYSWQELVIAVVPSMVVSFVLLPVVLHDFLLVRSLRVLSGDVLAQVLDDMKETRELKEKVVAWMNGQLKGRTHSQSSSGSNGGAGGDSGGPPQMTGNFGPPQLSMSANSRRDRATTTSQGHRRAETNGPTTLLQLFRRLDTADVGYVDSHELHKVPVARTPPPIARALTAARCARC
jgi:uncharacterized membrane protein YgcG